MTSTGDSVDFCAPGDGDNPVSRPRPDNQKTDFALTPRASQTPTGPLAGWEYFGGTSMAAPQVAGVAALGYAAYRYQPCVRLYEVVGGHGDLRAFPNTVAVAMAATADGRGPSGWPNNKSNTYGWGMPNAERLVRALLNVNNEGNLISPPAGSQAASLSPPEAIEQGLVPRIQGEPSLFG